MAFSQTDLLPVTVLSGFLGACCTLGEDLIETVRALAKQNRFDHLVIESTGISEPMPVAATFGWEFENGLSLSQVAKLDTMVTVVDASTFLTEVARGEALADRQMSAGEGDSRNVADLLVDQVEFADVLPLNKTDLGERGPVGGGGSGGPPAQSHGQADPHRSRRGGSLGGVGHRAVRSDSGQ